MHHICHSHVHLQTGPPPPPLSLVFPHSLDAAAGLAQQKAVHRTGMEWGLPQLWRWEDNKEWAQATHVCTYVAHTVHLMSYMPSPACTSALHLNVVTRGTLDTCLTMVLQLTIFKDGRGIGVALHMGRGFLLIQGRPTVGLHCMVDTTQDVKSWQLTHT